MLKAALLLSLATLAVCQINFGNLFNSRFGFGIIANVHDYRVQYDDFHNLVIFFNDDKCYLVETEGERRWDALLGDRNDLDDFTAAVYKLIEANGNEVHHLRHSVASSQYHSILVGVECINKEIYKVDYTPSN